jgi:phosphatidylglycerol:prolipoprotein diacylglycerol transferase
VRPVLFEIPIPFTGLGLPIFAYGFCLLLGFLAGAFVTRRRAPRWGIDPDLVYDLGVVVLFSGVLGARVLFVMINWKQYRGNPLEMFKVWHGGMVFLGGLFLAVACGIWYLRRRKVSVAVMAGLLAPSLMLGLSFGRIGCFLNGCCYGDRSDAPVSIRFPRLTEERVEPYPPREGDRGVVRWERRAGGIHVTRVRGAPVFLEHLHEGWVTPAHTDSLPVLPTQAFSGVGAVLLFVILSFYLERTKRPGRVFLLMGILYPIDRFVMEALRGDNPPLGEVWSFTDPIPLVRSLTLSQNLGIALCLVSAYLWWATRNLPAPKRK